MTGFVKMNQLVLALFRTHQPNVGEALFGSACLAYKAERDQLLIQHGWQPADFADRIEAEVSKDDGPLDDEPAIYTRDAYGSKRSE